MSKKQHMLESLDRLETEDSIAHLLDRKQKFTVDPDPNGPHFWIIYYGEKL
jgi:hypothetical protein